MTAVATAEAREFRCPQQLPSVYADRVRCAGEVVGAVEDLLDGVANEDEIPEIAAEITFLTPEEGGRREPVNLSAGLYRPHVVVGDPNQRHAIVRDGNVVDEKYLGVQFKPTTDRCELGVPQSVVLQLMYYPRVNYGGLVPGATFTVREGARVVAFGHVLEPSEHAV